MEQEPTGKILDQQQLGFHHIATNGTIAAAVNFDGRVHLYDLTSQTKIATPELDASTEKYWAVALSAENTLLALSTIDGLVEVWETSETVAKKSTLVGSKKGFGVSVDISSDGTLVATGHNNGGLYIFNVETERLLFSIPGHNQPLRSVRFSPGNFYLAVGSDSKVISLYNVASGEHVVNLSGHEGWIFSLSWSQGGDFLLSCSYDGRAKVWSMENMTCVNTQTDNDKPLLGAAWLDKGWGKGVIGGKNKGFVTVGVECVIRWYREAAGS